MEILNENTQIPIYNWAIDIEKDSLIQAKNLANLDFAYHHIALMADCHLGYGMPIGGILATRNKIIPNAVGVDIGCGVCAIKSNFREKIDIEALRKIIKKVKKNVPVGFRKHKMGCIEIINKMLNKFNLDKDSVCFKEKKNAAISLGTLGGGNHFIDFLRDEENYLWIMIHSGSRNLGKKVCDFYNNIAKKINFIGGNLSSLDIDSKYGKDYLKEMNFCLAFAFENRKRMMEISLNCVRDILGDIEFEDVIDIHHNYAVKEIHFGEEVIVHRKGSISAKLNKIGIIPGSQGTSSFIVRGKGNKDSFESCSHGAGRILSRKKALETLNFEKEKKKLELRGILHGIQNKKDLDEAVGVYKDINDVMGAQKDLVEIITKLEPIGILKG